VISGDEKSFIFFFRKSKNIWLNDFNNLIDQGNIKTRKICIHAAREKENKFFGKNEFVH
jgi:hypothetical protein